MRCRDERDEAEHVVRAALERLEQGIPLKRQAVLFRTAHHSDVLEVELGRRRIPFRKYGGLRFLDTAHVKDLVAFLRVVENPADETAWFRVLKLLQGVGPKTARRVVEALAAARFELVSLDTTEVPVAAKPSWDALRALLREVAPDAFSPGTAGREGAAALPCAAAVERIRAFYEPILEERYDHASSRRADLDAVHRLAQASPSRRELLADLALDPPAATGDLAGAPNLDEDWLVLSTIHSAKGLEWDAVSLLHAVDGCVPSDLATGDVEEIEEERRLLYVALTRARRHLTVLAPLRFHVKDRGPTDRHVWAPLSRFLPDSVASLFEARAAAPDGAGDAPRTGGPSAADGVRARLLARWSTTP